MSKQFRCEAFSKCVQSIMSILKEQNLIPQDSVILNTSDPINLERAVIRSGSDYKNEIQVNDTMLGAKFKKQWEPGKKHPVAAMLSYEGKMFGSVSEAVCI